MIDFESYKQANELTQQGKWLDALKIYQKLLKNDQTNSYLWYKVGEMYEETGNDKDAVICIEKAHSLGYGKYN